MQTDTKTVNLAVEYKKLLTALIDITGELGEWLDASDDQFGREQNEPYQEAARAIDKAHAVIAQVAVQKPKLKTAKLTLTMQTDTKYAGIIKNLSRGTWVFSEKRGYVKHTRDENKALVFYDELDAEVTLSFLNEVYPDCYQLIDLNK